MLKKVRKYLNDGVNANNPLDPSVFNDSLAEKVDWKPMRTAHAFPLHKLKKVNDQKMEFRSRGLILCPAVILIEIITFMHLLSSEYFYPDVNIGLKIIVLLLIILGTIAILYPVSIPVIFDKKTGYFWRGRREPDKIVDVDKSDRYTKISDIHALQITVSRKLTGIGGYYFHNYYELDLVLKDGSRISVIGHGNYKKLEKDSEALSEFLGVPLWDSVQAKYNT